MLTGTRINADDVSASHGFFEPAEEKNMYSIVQ
jgi:hypothetical protein